ncbi:hypothetical protein GCM10025867_49870 (plasmid) [Frondihabitans sucicola]|uniref:Uncharacterized protein n=1 Tax=Frondihabitans sucicola TaxID=1268041 RepID=A0ABN6Y6U7_9MICO|nr:hypothetical protein [Frondihabitans sucicola]BDZ52746.1 hypothetical protein GCM10025867_49870 [Frondihabitans sucicola]
MARKLSKNEQDSMVVEMAVSLDGNKLGDEKFEEMYEQLDASHQEQVDEDLRTFANNAVGDDDWE